jgi:hypothetical protein
MFNKFYFIVLGLFLFIAFGSKTFSQTGSQTFTSSGTFTVPSGVTSITIELVSAGGSGGGNGGGGGGGGGYAKGVYTVVPLSVYTVTVGTAGGGISGGTTGVGALISATGGENGTWVPNPNLGGGGAGGVGSNGTIANRTGGIGGGGFWTYFGGGGGGAAGSVSNGFAGGNTIVWTGICQTPGGASGLDGGVPGGAGGKGAGFTDVNCNITNPAGNGLNYGGGGGGGNGNGGIPGTGIGGYVLISWEIIVPVELFAFSAYVASGNVVLNWITETELNNQKFVVERRISEGQFVTIGNIQGNGTTTERKYYSFTDASVEAGKYFYRLKQVDFDGSFEYSNEVSAEVTAPIQFALDQNYPNPFNPTTSISFSLAEQSFVKLAVYNLLGEVVQVLKNENMNIGSYDVSFDAASLPNGMYLYKIETAKFTSVRKMMLMK